MSYHAQYQMAYDQSLCGRMVAATASEHQAGNTQEDPERFVADNRHYLVASSEWAAAWDSALAAENPDPGADPGVITDQMILSSVQSLLGAA